MALSFNILVADRQLLFTEGLRAIVEEEDYLQVVGVVSRADEVIQMVSHYKPHLLITELFSPEASGTEILHHIKKHIQETRVLVLIQKHSDYLVYQILQAGVKGILVKDCGPNDLITAIKNIRRGGVFFGRTISHKMVNMLSGPRLLTAPLHSRFQFTPMEKQVIYFICKEYNTKEIAAALNLTYYNVEHIRRKIQKKIGCRNVAGIVMFALENGMV
jgi:DNA-binding NarL/FixJ family response regulator